MSTTQKAHRVVTYTRISDDKADDGHGVANQQKLLSEYAAGRLWTVVAEESDNDVSGYSGKLRPGYERVLRLVASGEVDGVLVRDQSRLSRADPAELERLIKICQRYGVKWHTMAGDVNLGDPDGLLTARLLGVIERHKVDRQKQDQKNALAAFIAKGAKVPGGQRAFGFRPQLGRGNTKREHEPAEAQAIRDGIDMVLRGNTLADVMREWNARGLKSPQAGQQRKGRTVPDSFEQTSAVHSILTNPRNAGLLATYKGGREWEILGDGNWEPIVPAEKLAAVTSLLRARSKTPARGAPALLSGRHGAGRCRCGSYLGHTVDVFGRGKYHCKKAGDRPGPHVWTAPAERIDELVRDDVLYRLSQPDAAGLVRAAVPEADVAGLSSEAAALRERRLMVADMLAVGEMDRGQFRRACDKIDLRLAAIDTELAAAAAVTPLTPFADFGRADEVWQGLDHSMRRAVIAELCTVVLTPHGRGREWTEDLADVRWRAAAE